MSRKILDFRFAICDLRKEAENLQFKISNQKSNRGVAIIIVVGLLSVLMLAAVAFSILMRIERKGAANFRQGVQARHMLWSALASAIDDINTSLDSETNFLVYPEWGGDVHSSPSGGMSYGEEAYVLSPTAAEFIPACMLADAENDQPYWQSISVSGEVRGRYAYLAVNCSGLLDANEAGGDPRLYGSDPSEIDISGLPEFNQPQDAEAFLDGCGKHIRYETLPELNNLNTNTQNFAVYSLAREGQRILLEGENIYQGTNKIVISGDVGEFLVPAKKAQILEGLKNSGITDTNFVFDSLIDYLDTNCIPGDLNGTRPPVFDKPYTEAVPMISEILVTNKLQNTGAEARATTTLHIEWHYPFVEASPYSFTLHTELKSTLTNTNTGDSSPPNVSYKQYPSQYNPDIDKDTYGVKQNANNLTVSVAATNTQTVKLKCEVRAWLTKNPGGEMVDAAPYPTNNYIELPEIIDVVPAVGEDVWGGAGKECIDPRFNWGLTGQFWKEYSAGQWHTLGPDFKGTTNFWTTFYYTNRTGLGDLRSPGLDEGLSMYVPPKGGRLRCVGELGNLLLGEDGNQYKFKTIRLYDKDEAKDEKYKGYLMNEVLKYFTLTNEVRRGLVNLNTKNANVLAAVFKGVPLGYPESTKYLLDGVEDDIADRITAGTTNGNFFFDVDEIGSSNHLDWTTILPNMSDLERESIISHSAGLLTVRHNLFTIILSAESYSETLSGLDRSGAYNIWVDDRWHRRGEEGYDDEVDNKVFPPERTTEVVKIEDWFTTGTKVASTHAVAEVWRDPFRDENGNHKCFVRYFKILED